MGHKTVGVCNGIQQADMANQTQKIKAGIEVVLLKLLSSFNLLTSSLFIGCYCQKEVGQKIDITRGVKEEEIEYFISSWIGKSPRSPMALPDPQQSLVQMKSLTIKDFRSISLGTSLYTIVSEFCMAVERGAVSSSQRTFIHCIMQMLEAASIANKLKECRKSNSKGSAQDEF